MLRGENIRDVAAMPIAVLADQQGGVGKSRREIRIVQRDDDGRAAVRALAQQLQRLELVIRIELVGRLIQQEEARCLREDRRQRGAPPLAARQGEYVALLVTGKSDGGERIRRDGEVAGRFPLPPRDMRMPAQQHGFNDARREWVLDILRQKRQFARERAARPLRHRQP